MSSEEKLSNIFNMNTLPELPSADIESIATNVPESIAHPLVSPTILLSDTKNTIEEIIIPEEKQTIINGKYVLESEDDKYFYCTYNTTYTIKVMKDEVKSTIKYRDAKGRLLKGYSLVNEAKSADNIPVKKRKKRFTSKSAQEYMEKDLLADALDIILNGDMKDDSKSRAFLELLKFQKPQLSKNTSESIVTIKNNEFDEEKSSQ